ncbi:hypothetical protein INT45_008276 [Circinella minor]|uniref:MULE transposase domain-containing protein n=1 Tax=Circinella minor TaxID=1195481 RepID=A0A8H7RS81_9FUNG|nr:hypothetical protein INT45_008276 [Circinella minor]
MIDCSVTEMDAILSTFGTQVQVLVCHWHIRRAWEKKLNNTADSKALRKKARVYSSSLMYAKDPEEFDGIHFHTTWLVTQVVDCSYRQSISQVFHGFEYVSLTKEEKKRHKTAYELDDDVAADYISAIDM